MLLGSQAFDSLSIHPAEPAEPDKKLPVEAERSKITFADPVGSTHHRIALAIMFGRSGWRRRKKFGSWSQEVGIAHQPGHVHRGRRESGSQHKLTVMAGK